MLLFFLWILSLSKITLKDFYLYFFCPHQPSLQNLDQFILRSFIGAQISIKRLSFKHSEPSQARHPDSIKERERENTMPFPLWRGNSASKQSVVFLLQLSATNSQTSTIWNLLNTNTYGHICMFALLRLGFKYEAQTHFWIWKNYLKIKSLNFIWNHVLHDPKVKKKQWLQVNTLRSMSFLMVPKTTTITDIFFYSLPLFRPVISHLSAPRYFPWNQRKTSFEYAYQERDVSAANDKCHRNKV